MPRLDEQMQVGHLVAERPVRSRVFESHGIDYCCGGRRTVKDACREQGLDVNSVLKELEDLDMETSSDAVDPLAMTMTELADHIEHTHHVYLRRELPRLTSLIEKVAGQHGETYRWLEDVRRTFAGLVGELEPHMMKEECILFPMIRELDRAEARPSFHCGSVNNPIRVMEQEHDGAGVALSRLRELTNDYTVPKDACNSFRAMLDGLEILEKDMHQHIHKENNVLFPRASELEEKL